MDRYVLIGSLLAVLLVLLCIYHARQEDRRNRKFSHFIGKSDHRNGSA